MAWDVTKEELEAIKAKGWKLPKVGYEMHYQDGSRVGRDRMGYYWVRTVAEHERFQRELAAIRKPSL